MKTVNIRDVAREAGTSTASVSRWLNGQPGVSRRTGERIMETAHRLGYRPALQRKTGVIALILPSLRIQSLGYYTIELLNAFRQEAAKRGSGVLITALEDAGLLRENMVSGAISFDFLRSIGRSFPNLKNIPLVCLNDPGNPLEEVGTVLTDGTRRHPPGSAVSQRKRAPPDRFSFIPGRKSFPCERTESSCIYGRERRIRRD